MGWIAVSLLALAAFGFAAFVLRLPKSSWTLFGAVLVFGLTGYAWQGSASQPGSPKAAMVQEPRSGEQMVEARRALFDAGVPKPNYLTVSDGFARRGRFSDAAGLLRGGLADNPRHAEGWLALGMALVEHADGRVTPAAHNAYDRASKADPANPAAGFFLGAAYFRTRQVREARAVWAELLERTPEDAPWHGELTQRLEVIDAMLSGAPNPAAQ